MNIESTVKEILDNSLRITKKVSNEEIYKYLVNRTLDSYTIFGVNVDDGFDHPVVIVSYMDSGTYHISLNEDGYLYASDKNVFFVAKDDMLTLKEDMEKIESRGYALINPNTRAYACMLDYIQYLDLRLSRDIVNRKMFSLFVIYRNGEEAELELDRSDLIKFDHDSHMVSLMNFDD